MKKILFSLLALTLFTSGLPALAETGYKDAAKKQNEYKETTLYFFWGKYCPYCSNQKQWLQQMKEKYPELKVKSFEIWQEQENIEPFQQMARAYGTEADGVPTTFIGDSPITGFNKRSKQKIKERMIHCLENGCIDPGEKGGLTEEELAQANTLFGDIKKTTGKEVIFDKQNRTCLHFFYKEECPHCRNVEGYLEELEKDHEVDINKYEVTSKPEKEIFESFKGRYGLTTASYPIVFVGNKYFIGDTSIRNNLEKEVSHCQNNSCPCPAETTRGFTPYLPESRNVTPEKQETIEVPFFGTIDLSTLSIYTTTSIIAFVDGFNPCSLWLITFLLGIVIHSNSRKKILAVGGTFLLVTGATYALFMAGLLNVFLYVGYLNWIQAIVAGVALIFAIVNIKDYFWYKKGISFTIPDKYKPKIFKNIRGIMNPRNSLIATITGTTILALGVVLVELPCTAGFPLIWTNMIAQQQIAGLTFLILLGIYMLIYLIDELLVVGGVFWTMRMTRFEEKHGRVLKLIGGMIMLALGMVMIINPDLMNQVSSAILIFAIAITASFLIMWIHRKILPRLGVHIGTEKGPGEKTPKEENKEEK